MAIDRSRGQDPADKDDGRSVRDVHNRPPDQSNPRETDHVSGLDHESPPLSETRTRDDYAREMHDQGPPISDGAGTGNDQAGTSAGTVDSRGSSDAPSNHRADDQSAAPDAEADHDTLQESERSFSSPREADAFMEAEIDRPVMERVNQIGDGIELHTSAQHLSDGGFSNVYDIVCDPGTNTARIHINERPVEPRVADQARGALVTTSAGFFFLTDKASELPRQASLNLAVNDGNIASLPVVDREAVMTRGGVLSAAHVRAEGEFAINGNSVTWEGSRTGRSAECYVYGNGNSVITHQKDATTGTLRVLDEVSKLTPPISHEQQGRLIDVGFMATDDGSFRSVATSTSGRINIFQYDIVARCPVEHIMPDRENRLNILRIGPIHNTDLPESAVSVGPSLDTEDFTAHAINSDRSLGSTPPFTERRMARMVLYEDLEDRTHLRLFDGRPGSRDFRGVTPSEARDAIEADTGYRWGCFLDPGQTAKIWTNDQGNPTSYGNRHYLRWPQTDKDSFSWVPDKGRPIPSFITIRQ